MNICSLSLDKNTCVYSVVFDICLEKVLSYLLHLFSSVATDFIALTVIIENISTCNDACEVENAAWNLPSPHTCQKTELS